MTLLAATGPYHDTSPLHSGGPVDNHINTVYYPLMWVSIVVFTLVFLAICYAAIRYRRRFAGEEPVQVHGNNRIELAWTVIPFAILISLFILTAVQMRFINNAPDNAMKVCVLGEQFDWRFFYDEQCGDPKTSGNTLRLNYGPPEGTAQSITTLYVPVGQPVALQVVSADVNHSFYVPTLAGQINAIPGQTNHMWLQADSVDTFYGQCTELCGTGHANMELKVTSLPQDKFNQCMQDLKARKPAPNACTGGG